MLRTGPPVGVGGRGSFLLSEPQNALRIVDAVLDAAAGSVPVTLKMRRGVGCSSDLTGNNSRVQSGGPIP